MSRRGSVSQLEGGARCFHSSEPRDWPSRCTGRRPRERSVCVCLACA
uniref:Uncharacterized protein n=1 Tax=Anguilla anguilla TaxID=7936 RepID=A0A0E9S9X9_ANGAN